MNAGRILVTRQGSGTLSAIAHLLWWDPSVRVVLVERDATGEHHPGYSSYVELVREAIDISGSEAVLLVSC